MQKNEIFNVKNITRLALAAAIYVTVTLCISPLSYGAVQFRFAEMLVLLCFYRKDYAPAMILACLIANLPSPLGWLDWVFGTAATALAVIPMYRVKNIFIAALLPVISNGIIVGIELHIALGAPVWINMCTVAIGELAVMIAGAVIFKLVFEKNRALMRLIGSTRNAESRVKTQ